MRIQLTKPVRTDLLYEELQAAFPTWWTGIDPQVTAPVDFYFYPDAAYVIVPDDADAAAVQAIIDAHDPRKPTKREVFRERVKQLAQSAVGVKLQDLTAGQIKAILACVLFQAGAVDPDTLTIRPLSEWVF